MEVNTSSTTDPVNMYNFVNSFLLNPTIFIIIFLVIIAFFILSSSLGNNSISSLSDSTSSSSSSGSGQNILGVIVIIVLVLLILVNAFQYFFSINITAFITDLFTDKPVINVVVDQSTYEPSSRETIKFKKQVFNVPGNYYNYTNAKALCNAYGGRLATYDEVEKSYNNGGEWCNYGWSDGQMALFPTQKKTFNNLQTIKGHEQDCGRPGINGGYIANPNVRFGVNCYGNKPRITDEEEELMKTSTPYPKTTQDIVFQKRVDYWKNKVDEILVSPFNYETWGSF
jgi:hypothetical protein